MAKIQNISGIHSTLGFPEFDILENYRKSFHESELGRLHIQPFHKDRPYGPEGIHRILRQAAGGISEREHTLPDVLWNHDKPIVSHNQLQDSQCYP